MRRHMPLPSSASLPWSLQSSTPFTNSELHPPFPPCPPPSSRARLGQARQWSADDGFRWLACSVPAWTQRAPPLTLNPSQPPPPHQLIRSLQHNHDVRLQDGPPLIAEHSLNLSDRARETVQ
eukprot:scaffold19864_cov101-Isochrysis_galbana.AAC.5